MIDRLIRWIDRKATDHYIKVGEKHPEIAEKYARARLGLPQKEKR